MTGILAKRRAPLMFGAATRTRVAANRINSLSGATTQGGETNRLAHKASVDLSGGFRIVHLLVSRESEQFLLTDPAGNQLAVESTTNLKYPLSVHTVVEYPASSGTFYPVTYDGEAIGYARMGDLVISDPVYAPVPANGLFQTRAYFGFSVVNNNFAFPLGSINSNSSGEGTIRSNPGVDNALVGGATFVGSVQPFGPCAIVTDAHPKRYAILVIGDSVAEGNLGYGVGWPEQCLTGITGLTGSSTATLATHDGSGMGVINCSIGNMRAAEDALPHFNARRMAIARRCTDVIVALGTNDLAGGRSVAQINADLLALIQRARLVVNEGRGRVHVCTIPPRTTGTWIAAAGLGQTVAATEADRVAVNTYLRTLPGGADTCIDIADTLETSRDSGKWTLFGAAAITGDGIHPNANGQQAIKAAIGVGPFT